MDQETLENGMKGLVKCRFLYHPEYLKKGQTFMLREGRTKVQGTILSVYDKEKTDKEK